jgi:hypothetical protein
MKETVRYLFIAAVLAGIRTKHFLNKSLQLHTSPIGVGAIAKHDTEVGCLLLRVWSLHTNCIPRPII